MENTHFKLFNHSSEDMQEIEDNSVDLIAFSPPYNTIACYDSVSDTKTWEDYKTMMTKIISECFRVLKKEGALFIESADSVFSHNKYVALAGMLQSIALKQGFNLITRNISFVRIKKNIELPDHGWDENYFAKRAAHSNCQQHLIFSKNKKKIVEGKINYFSYPQDHDYANENQGDYDHPCPYPKKLINFILDNYFKKGFTVLDTFAGTCGLGEEVLKREGNFIGFDLSKKYLDIGEKKMKNALEKV